MGYPSIQKCRHRSRFRSQAAVIVIKALVVVPEQTSTAATDRLTMEIDSKVL